MHSNVTHTTTDQTKDGMNMDPVHIYNHRHFSHHSQYHSQFKPDTHQLRLSNPQIHSSSAHTTPNAYSSQFWQQQAKKMHGHEQSDRIKVEMCLAVVTTPAVLAADLIGCYTSSHHATHKCTHTLSPHTPCRPRLLILKQNKPHIISKWDCSLQYALQCGAFLRSEHFDPVRITRHAHTALIWRNWRINGDHISHHCNTTHACTWHILCSIFCHNHSHN